MFDFLLTGHRGNPVRYPENTVSSMQGAISCRATAVEADVRATSDGVLVLAHDPNLQRVSGRSVEISETTFSELRRITFQGERVATLSEVAGVVRGVVALDLDIKVEGYEREMLKVISSSGDLRKTLFTSFSPNVVSTLKSLSSECRAGLLEQGAFSEATEVAQELKVDSILPEVSDVDRDSLRRAKEVKLSVIPWTVDDPEIALSLFDLGVDGIITDDPCGLAEPVFRHLLS